MSCCRLTKNKKKKIWYYLSNGHSLKILKMKKVVTPVTWNGPKIESVFDIFGKCTVFFE